MTALSRLKAAIENTATSSPDPMSGLVTLSLSDATEILSLLEGREAKRGIFIFPSHAQISGEALNVLGDEESPLNIEKHRAFIKGGIYVLDECIKAHDASATPSLSDEQIEGMAVEKYPDNDIYDELKRKGYISGFKAALTSQGKGG